MLQNNIDKIVIGTALAFAASALLPIAKTTFRPLAEAGMQGGVNLINRGKSYIQLARQEVEDIVAEAQFERMKRQLDQEISLLDNTQK
ncbi:UNVERIFIED_CONTAM: exonuclease VII small subunit [Paenibacillus sp. PvR008]